MATPPSNIVSIDAAAVAQASGTDTVCIFAPCATSADATPRPFGSAALAQIQHGYCDGVDYAAYHIGKTGKSFLFVGLPIATPGVVGRVNQAGNTGSSVVSAAAGGSGVLGEHEGDVLVETSGTIGSGSGPFISYSLDGGRTRKRVRLGVLNSYVIPYVGVTLSFGAGTLVAGDTPLTWFGSGPRSDAAGWAAGRAALADVGSDCRSIVLVGDLQNSAEANAFLAEVEAYKNSNGVMVYARASVRDRLPLASMSHVISKMTGAPTLTFAEVGASADTVTRSAGSWISDGFAVGDTVAITGSASNNVTGPVTGVSATVLTFGTTDLNPEGPVGGCTVTATPTLTFAEVGATADTLTRSRGSWLDDGFRALDTVAITGTASNNVTGQVTGVTALALTFGTTDLTPEVLGTAGVGVVTGETESSWLSTIDAAFSVVSSVDGQLTLSAGRGRLPSGITGFSCRRSEMWAASAREYQHDLHIPNWRPADGGTGADLYAADGKTRTEFDDRAFGGGALAARFECFKTWGGGDKGAYVELDVTRANDDSLLSRTHNVAVVCGIYNVTMKAVRQLLGETPELDAAGHATSAQLSLYAQKVNASLDLFIKDRGEGRRASSVEFLPSKTDVLNVPGAELTGVILTQLNGTIEHTRIPIRIRTAGL